MVLILFKLLQYEGTPFYPDNDRFWVIVEKYKVNQFYTAPTAIRALMKFDSDLVKRFSFFCKDRFTHFNAAITFITDITYRH